MRDAYSNWISRTISLHELFLAHLLILLALLLVDDAVADQKVFLQQLLRKVIKDLIVGAQTVRSRDTGHTCHFVHVDQGPAPCEDGPVLPIEEHHVGHHPHVMLPPVTELVPPLLLNHFGLVNLIDRPQLPVALVEEDGLKDVVFIGDRGLLRLVVFAELVLVVGTVERHLDLRHVLGI